MTGISVISDTLYFQFVASIGSYYAAMDFSDRGSDIIFIDWMIRPYFSLDAVVIYEW